MASTNGAKTKSQEVQTDAEEVPRPYAEIGKSGLRRFGGEVQEEFDPQLRGTRGVRVYDEMRKNDSDVGSILFAILHIALAATWDFEPASQEQPDLDAAQFMREVMFEDISWRKFITAAMSSNAFGWAFHELVFKQRLGADGDPPSRFNDGRIGLHKIALRGQETLKEWKFGPHGEVLGMWQRSHDSFDEVFLPIEKALLCRTSDEKDNPEGVSLLRTAYRPYFIKTNMEEIEVIGAERDMTGVLDIQVPSNAVQADFDKAQLMGQNYRVDDQAFFITQKFGPGDHEGWKISVIQTPGNRVVDTDKTISRCSIQIMRATLAQFLTLGASRVGSFALADSMRGLWHLAVNGRLDTFAEEIDDQVTPKLLRLNTIPGITGMPKLTHTDPGEIDLEELTPFLRVIGELGMLAPNQAVLEHMHDRADLPAPDPDAWEKMEADRKAEESRREELQKMQITSKQQSEQKPAQNRSKSDADPGEPRNLPKSGSRSHQTQSKNGKSDLIPRAKPQ